MKKLTITACIIVMLLALIAYPAAAIQTFIIVYDFPGNFESEQDAESGLTIAGESLYSLGKVVTLGYGVEIPVHTVKSPDVFGFVPAFGILKIAPFDDFFPMDFTVRAGYSFLTGDHAYADNSILTGGLYYGYGLGYFLHRDKEEGSYSKLELLYSVSNGTRTVGASTSDLTYSRFSLLISFGYESL